VRCLGVVPTSILQKVANALLRADVIAVVRAATSDHIGEPWEWQDFVDLSDRASHPCGVFGSHRLSVFAKLSTEPRGMELFDAELKGLALLRTAAGVRTATPIGPGMFVVDGGVSLFLSEGLSGRHGALRTPDDWRAMGRTLAVLHRAHGDRFGLDDFDGFFGPLPQDNRPTHSLRWADFYIERRLVPRLRDAVDSGHLSRTLADGVEQIVGRLHELTGPEPQPSLLHGDPQQNNMVSTGAGTVLVDAAPYFGHPEADLALVDYFEPVSEALFDGYREDMPIDAGFAMRRRLWRLHADLAAIAVGGAFGLSRLPNIGDAVDFYR
jgi:fructosamine-3-kinase